MCSNSTSTARRPRSYAMNLMRDDADVDPRAKALLDPAHAALLGRDGRRAGVA
jgi:hypothetical protein